MVRGIGQAPPSGTKASVLMTMAVEGSVSSGLVREVPRRFVRARLVTARSFVASIAGWAVLLGCLLVPSLVQAQIRAKSVEGKVYGAGPGALPGAIVYLQDEKTNVIKTLIATADGGYLFGQLPADTDYQLWAEYKGKKSKVRLISSFDTKPDVTQNFHIAGN